MATKFGYVRREATDQVDWGAVATQFTTILGEEIKSRESQKKELEDRSREMVETLQNSPTGDYVDGNQFISDYAADAQQVLLTQDRLLRQGILKPRDYSTVRANLNDSNKMMFKLGDAYQEAYKLKMERMNSADPATRSQMLEQWKMEQAEGLYNLKNSKALINPNSGVVSIGLWKDGKMDTNPNSYQTVPELMSNLKGTYNYYDVRKDINTAVDDLGLIDELSVELAGYQGGLDQLITTTSQGGKFSGNKKLLNEYNKWADYTSEGMMSNPFHVTSILTNENLMVEVDGKKVPYTFTYESDPNKRKANEIYLNRENDMGGQPEFTDDQKKVVKNAIKQRLNDSIDKKIKSTASRVPFDRDAREKGEATEKYEKTFSMLGDIFYGDAKKVDAAETYFRDLLGAVKVRKSGDTIYVTDADGNTKPVPMRDKEGNLMDFETFAESAVLLTGVSNIADSVDLAGGVRTGKVKSISAGDNDTEYVIEFFDGRKETRNFATGKDGKPTQKITDKYFTELKGKTIGLGSMTPSGSGAGVMVDETDQQFLDRYLQKALTVDNVLMEGDTVITDDEYVQTKLAPFIQGLGFKIENPVGMSNYLSITRPNAEDGETPHYFYTSKDDMQAELQALMDYIRSGTPVANIAAQESLMTKYAGPRVSGGGVSGVLD